MPDSLAMGQSNNLYGYTMNNPVNNVDLNGEFIITGKIIVGGLILGGKKVVAAGSAAGTYVALKAPQAVQSVQNGFKSASNWAASNPEQAAQTVGGIIGGVGEITNQTVDNVREGNPCWNIDPLVVTISVIEGMINGRLFTTKINGEPVNLGGRLSGTLVNFLFAESLRSGFSGDGFMFDYNSRDNLVGAISAGLGV